MSCGNRQEICPQARVQHFMGVTAQLRSLLAGNTRTQTRHLSGGARCRNRGGAARQLRRNCSLASFRLASRPFVVIPSFGAK